MKRRWEGGDSRVRGRAILVLLALWVVGSGAAEAPAVESEPQRLRMLHTHTGEKIDVVYFRNGTYIAEALGDLNRFLRDFRTGEVHPIDVQTLDILWQLQNDVGNPDGVYEIISGFRSKKTNEMLRERGSTVAKNSQHVKGKAIDVRLTGTDTAKLRDAAIGLQLGGVGYYESSDFVHVDSGRVRRW